MLTSAHPGMFFNMHSSLKSLFSGCFFLSEVLCLPFVPQKYFSSIVCFGHVSQQSWNPDNFLQVLWKREGLKLVSTVRSRQLCLPLHLLKRHQTNDPAMIAVGGDY